MIVESMLLYVCLIPSPWIIPIVSSKKKKVNLFNENIFLGAAFFRTVDR